MVDFQLTPRQMELKDTAKRFATEVMIPAAEVADRIEDPEESFNWEVIREGSRRGLRTLTVPRGVWRRRRRRSLLRHRGRDAGLRGPGTRRRIRSDMEDHDFHRQHGER